MNWLLEANEREAHRRSMFRDAHEEEQMQLMGHPLAARRAYTLFGMLLGLLPPAVIFARMFGYGFSPRPFGNGAFIFFMCLAMNVVCALAGGGMGAALSSTLERLSHWSWTRMLLILPFIGAIWGAVAGFAGGLIFFGIGAVAGLICAIPVGMSAFTLFAPLHRLLARGGMIDARHFWPLACGVTMIVSALILGL
ncbi:MAG: hypothetical protein WCF57_11315 [Pyrinomonadaceae bacterium]